MDRELKNIGVVMLVALILCLAGVTMASHHRLSVTDHQIERIAVLLTYDEVNQTDSFARHEMDAAIDAIPLPRKWETGTYAFLLPLRWTKTDASCALSSYGPTKNKRIFAIMASPQGTVLVVTVPAEVISVAAK